MFASVYQVFDRASEMIGGDKKEREVARDLVRKMVNSMSAKMEIGSPMASMYLLGHPDHYASHIYATFFWKSYVHCVRSFWVNEMDQVDPDQRDTDEGVPLGKQDGKIIATSAVDDYRYRPAAYEHISLYEWVQCSEKKLRTKKERLHDWETDDEDETIVASHEANLKANLPSQHSFLPEHDLFYSHSVSCDFSKTSRVIPNFIGGAMPRADKGDRSYYCLTM
ncbi:hypothetical protein B0H13DRAFT_1499171, partial [Mycena leptocephala]